MRLVYTTHDAGNARTLASFLAGEGIENQLEMVKGSDWGQANYGDTTFKIWVIDEDFADSAEKWVEAFEKDPANPVYKKTGGTATVIPAVLSEGCQGGQTGREKFKNFMHQENKRDFKNTQVKQEPFRTTTIGLLMLCCLFYLISNLTAPNVESIPPGIPGMPIVSSQITKEFLYDYPKAYSLADKLFKLYGIERLQSPQELPSEGQYLFKKLQGTPYWEGYYNQVLAYFRHEKDSRPNAPLFEKIKEGEVWRLFTPSLMHNEFLHLLFNMLWLIVLGKQLEQRLNPRRYMFLILILGIFSNTCQYLMGGPNFLGFSGVVCGMAAFIWVRQRIAPWEGYPLEQATVIFIAYFITALLIIQTASFFMEVYYNQSISPGIANTGHFTGAIMGILLGLLPFFKKTSQPAGNKK